MGLFWPEETKRAPRYTRVQPVIPATGWTPPRDFPNLRGVREIGLDTETFDPDLLTYGPGWSRGSGHIVGVSVATVDAQWYFPIRHTVEPHLNLDERNVMAWLRDTLASEHRAVAGANLIYDLGWLAEYGITVNGTFADIQYAESLLTESSPTALEDVAQKYLGAGKETPALYQWLADAYGGKANGEQRANIYRAPVSMVGPYAEADAALPLRLMPILYRRMQDENLCNVFAVENALTPLLIAMRRAGVNVDTERAQQVRETLKEKQGIAERELRALCGFEVNCNAGASVAVAFDKFGLRYPVSAAGKGSFKQEFLASVQHPVAGLITRIRKIDKLCSTFIDSYVMNASVKGKLHVSFHPLRGTEGGARSGRFASSKPNGQNIPSRDPELSALIRSVFVKEFGHLQWRRYDYSQIEYRFLAHFAVGEGADGVRAMYAENPNIDYHDMTIELVHNVAGFKLDRKPAKNVNFGLIYGMGKKKLIRSLGLTDAKGEELFAAYHMGAPFARATMDAYANEAQQTGRISTILGRVSRFDLWEPMRYSADKSQAVPLAIALERWPGQALKRGATHKALNRKLQGSAADMMKIAMLKCWESGLFDGSCVPRLTVHDELDFSDDGEHDAEYAAIRRVLETAIPLRVPVVADCDTGPDWGHLTELKQCNAF